MATFTSFFSPKNTGKSKEELDSVISNLSPAETPFFSSIKKGSCSSVNPEWLTESLLAANPTPRVEGAEIAAADEIASGVTRKTNYVETHYKACKVTTLGNKVDAAGSRPEMAHQIALRGKEMKNEIELRLTGSQASAVGSASVAREMAGYQAQIDAGNVNSNGDVARALSEAQITDVMLKLYNNGGDATKLMMKPKLKVDFSAIMDAKTNVRREIGNNKKLVATVTLYESDFGTLEVVPNRFLANDANSQLVVLVYNPSHWGVVQMHGFVTKNLPANGFYERKVIGWTGTLIHRNPVASGLINDLV